MSAKKQMTEHIILDDKIGIIAGRGDLPKILINSLNEKNVKPFVIALNDITEKDSLKNAEILWVRIGNAGKIISFFKDNNVKKIVLAGGLKRPSFTSLIPDSVGLKLLNKIRKQNDIGDNTLLSLVIKFLEEYGFEILGVDEIATELVAEKGEMTNESLHKKIFKDIDYGKRIAEEIGRLDIGQAVIVQNGVTLGVEGIDGTDELIKRCAHLQHEGKGAILVKMKKPKQDRRIDLPSIGISTIERLHENKMKGVAIEAGNSLIINKQETIKMANDLGVFIYGI